MIDRAFALHCRFQLWLLSGQINNDGLWDRNLSQCLDCLDHLIMTFGGKGSHETDTGR